MATKLRRAALFDLDETLIDRRGTLDGYARDLFAAFASRIALGEDAFVQMLHSCDDLGRAPKVKFFHSQAAQGFEEMSPAELAEHYGMHAWARPRLFAGVPELLHELRLDGFRIGLVTNGSVATQTAKIVNSGLAGRVDTTVISAAVGLRKPDRTIFELALTELGVAAEHARYAGDNPQADVVGAYEAGIRSAWVQRHFPWPDELPRCYETAVSQTPDLLPWYRQALN